MNKVRDIRSLIEKERTAGIEYGSASWHWQYRHSPYIFISNIDSRLSEGDLIVAFSQFGEVVDLKMGRDKITGEPRGFCWLAYEDPRSKVLAIEGMCGTDLLGRTLMVDHAAKHLSMLTSNQPLTFATIGTALAQRKAELNNANGEMVELFSIDNDAELDQRRQMIWDYEAFYVDSEDEQYSQILHERLLKGEDLILDPQSQIVNRNELQEQKTTPTSTSTTTFTLADISKTYTDRQLDDFNDLHETNTSTPATANKPLFTFSFDSAPQSGSTKSISTTELLDDYGTSLSHLSQTTHPTELSILDQLKKNRLARKQKEHHHDGERHRDRNYRE